MQKQKKSLYILTGIIIFLGMIVTLTGLLYTNGGVAYDFINQYGDTVKIYGNGYMQMIRF